MSERDEFNFEAPVELDMQDTTAGMSSATRKYRSILSEKEARVFELIITKPGISKEDIARHFTDLSRVTIMKNLKFLEEKDLIISLNNPKNRQTLSVYINNKSILIKVNDEILEFKQHIFKLLDGLDKYFNEIGFDNSQNNADENIQHIFNSLREIFEDFVRFYFSRAMLQWQNSILNDLVRFQLYDIVIKNTIEIQRRLSKFIPTGLYDIEVCIDDDEDEKRINRFSKIGLGVEIKSLVRATQDLRFNYRKPRSGYSN